MVHVCFVRMDLGGTVVTSGGGDGGGSFVVAFNEMLGGVRNDVEAHEKEENGHSKAGEDLCALKAVGRC